MIDSTQSEPVSHEKKNKVGNILLASGLIMLLVTGAFFSGLQMGTAGSTTPHLEASLFSFLRHEPEQPEEVDMTEFWRVWDLMEEKFVYSSSSEKMTDEEKVRGAIEGLVKGFGDPYTMYLPPKDASMFEEDISGEFGGIGVEMGMRDGLVTAIAPLADTPAQKAGILPGDIFVKVDGESIEGIALDDVVRMIRGEVGTTVDITVYRAGEPDYIEFSIERGKIEVPTIDTKVDGEVFVISLYNFNAVSEVKMQEALIEFSKSGKEKMVLDLRGNPGGYLQSAITIGSFFLPTGKVIVREGAGDDDDILHRSTGRTISGFQPEEMVVLINGGSASASEILAGALGEHGAATLMGETTFGKGSVQELVDLPEKSSLKVTIARWFTPNGESISDGGLDPDVFVERTVEQFMAGEDPQLDAAIEWLNGNKDVGTTTKSAMVFEEEPAG